MPPERPAFPIPEPEEWNAIGESNDFVTQDTSRVLHKRKIFATICCFLSLNREAAEALTALAPGREHTYASSAVRLFQRALEITEARGSVLAPNAGSDDDVAIARFVPALSNDTIGTSLTAVVKRTWFHLFIVGLFLPLLSSRQTIVGFQCPTATARAVYLASARQLQHLVLVYRLSSPLALMTPAWHGSIAMSAISIAMSRPTPETPWRFAAYLQILADLAGPFPGLYELYQGLALTGLQVGLLPERETRAELERMVMARKSAEVLLLAPSTSQAGDARRLDSKGLLKRQGYASYLVEIE